jgi:site-specific DNA recombinase
LDPDDQISLEPDRVLRLVISVRPVFRGGRTWLVNPRQLSTAPKPKIDGRLVASVRKAHAWLANHDASPSAKADVLRNAASPDNTYLRRLVQLAFLAPDIQRAIIEGRQLPGLTAAEIAHRGVPLAWADQRALFDFPV